MNIKDFIENPKLAIAKAVYDANPKSAEEMMQVLDTVEETTYQFRYDIYSYICIFGEIKYNREENERIKPRLEKLLEFKKSRVGILIAQFCNNNSPELLAEIEREIKLDNRFNISICGESQTIISNGYLKFYIHAAEVVYYSHIFDLEEDIHGLSERISDYENRIAKLERYKMLLEEKYGETLSAVSWDLETINPLLIPTNGAEDYLDYLEYYYA